MEEEKNVCLSKSLENKNAIEERDGTENNGWIRLIRAELTPPSLSDNTADADRLLKELKKELDTEYVGVDLSLLKTVSDTLKRNEYEVHAALFENRGIWKIIDIFDREKRVDIYGIALDLGSTTLALQLVHLTGGRIIDEVSFNNPQIRIGPDILTRIHYATAPGRSC